MKHKAQPDHPFEPRFVEMLRDLFESRIAFNRVLGLTITSFNPERAQAKIMMREDLLGHFAHSRLHGGVISATLDAMGGLAVMLAIGSRHMDDPVDTRLHRFAKLGTIDLRVDFLRPAIGAAFHASAEVMRLGSRVASTRMDFRDEDGELLSTGAAAYIVS